MQLQIECTNVCNADCVFCPYTKMTRAKGTMDLALFRRIVDDAATIPQIDRITITGLGEPLLDRHLPERIRYIRTKMPNVLLDVYTNGSFLRPALTDQLIDAGLTVLYVSLNAVNAEKRQAVMKLGDYDQVVEYIHYAQAAGAGKMQVIVKSVVAKDLMEASESTFFVQIWRGEYGNSPNGAAFQHLEGNWAGDMWPMRVQMTQPCDRALNQIMILQDGRVSLCCFDADGREILGDLTTQSIRDVFNGEKATGIRLAHVEGRRQSLPLCAGCTGI